MAALGFEEYNLKFKFCEIRVLGSYSHVCQLRNQPDMSDILEADIKTEIYKAQIFLGLCEKYNTTYSLGKDETCAHLQALLHEMQSAIK